MVSKGAASVISEVGVERFTLAVFDIGIKFTELYFKLAEIVDTDELRDYVAQLAEGTKAQASGDEAKLEAFAESGSSKIKKAITKAIIESAVTSELTPKEKIEAPPPPADLLKAISAIIPPGYTADILELEGSELVQTGRLDGGPRKGCDCDSCRMKRERVQRR